MLSKKKFNVLSENYKPSYSTATIMHDVDGVPTRFKIYYENGNSYARGGIMIQTKNLDFAKIYSDCDVPKLKFESWYNDNDDKRITCGAKCVEEMAKFIQVIFK